MDRRTKILAGLFLAFVGYGLVSKVVYPAWIEPLFTIDDRIAEQREELDKLEAVEAEVDRAKWTYREFLDRVGSFDATNVENDLRARINQLIARHELEDATTSGGSGKLPDYGKTDAQVMNLSGSAKGTLEGVIGFLKDLAELPHLVRVGDVKIYPAHSAGRRQKSDRMYLRVPLKVLVLPQDRALGDRLADQDLRQPERFVRHRDQGYSEIWERKPFTEYVEIKPLVARAGRTLTVDVGAKASLAGAATGGDGDYTFNWVPEEGLSNTSMARPALDTSSPWEREYTLTVTDGDGRTATATVMVTVREKQAVAEAGPDQDDEEEEPSGAQLWQDRRHLELKMALIRNEADTRLGEVMVYNNKSRKTAFYPVGGDFDGGKLVYVHPRGAVTHRQDEYFVYPIGETLSRGMPAKDATEHPTLQHLAERIRERYSPPSADPMERDRGESGERGPRGPDSKAGRPRRVRGQRDADREVKDAAPDRPGVEGPRPTPAEPSPSAGPKDGKLLEGRKQDDDGDQTLMTDLPPELLRRPGPPGPDEIEGPMLPTFEDLIKSEMEAKRGRAPLPQISKEAVREGKEKPKSDRAGAKPSSTDKRRKKASSDRGKKKKTRSRPQRPGRRPTRPRRAD